MHLLQKILIVVGGLAVLIGAVWIGQGSGVIPGSFMTGDRTWLGIGLAVACVGVALVYIALQRPAAELAAQSRQGRAAVMSRLTYAVLTSLDGYVNDASGGFEWAAPDPEVHAFANDLERWIGTHLYGRRLYEVMAFWETAREQHDCRMRSGSMPSSGRTPTRSSTLRPWSRRPRRAPGWSDSSSRTRCVG